MRTIYWWLVLLGLLPGCSKPNEELRDIPSRTDATPVKIVAAAPPPEPQPAWPLPDLTKESFGVVADDGTVTDRCDQGQSFRVRYQFQVPKQQHSVNSGFPKKNERIVFSLVRQDENTGKKITYDSSTATFTQIKGGIFEASAKLDPPIASISSKSGSFRWFLQAKLIRGATGQPSVVMKIAPIQLLVPQKPSSP